MKGRYDDLAKTGHGIQRHGAEITEKQLRDRSTLGMDPMIGKSNKIMNSPTNVTSMDHRYSKHATKFTTKESFVRADLFIEKSKAFKEKMVEAEIAELDKFAVTVNLKDVYGKTYKEHVFGKTRIGTKKQPVGTKETDFTEGTIKAVFKKDSESEWFLYTMYPEPKQ